MCKGKLTSEIPHLEVVKNCSKSGLSLTPRIGAFEIKFRDKSIFSKLKTASWPHADLIVQRISELMRNPTTSEMKKRVKSPSKKMFRTEEKKKTHRKTMSSPASPLVFGSKSAHRNPFSASPAAALSSRGFMSSSRLSRPIGLSLEDTDVSVDPVSKFQENYVYSLAAELQKGKHLESEHPLRPVTLACQVTASSKCRTAHAIEYRNRGLKQAKFLVVSSHATTMEVKRSVISIPSGGRGLFELDLDSGGKVGDKTMYLYVDREGAPWECIEVQVSFRDV